MHHVVLSLPPADAPLKQREHAYAELRPVTLEQREVTFHRRIIARRQTYVDFVELANGTRVWAPEDLRPLVPIDSVVARSAMRSVRARRTAETLRVVGSLGLIAGFVAASAGLLRSDDDSRPRMIGFGLGAMGLGLAMHISSRYAKQSEEDAAQETYSHFDEALRTQLAVGGVPAGKILPKP